MRWNLGRWPLPGCSHVWALWGSFCSKQKKTRRLVCKGVAVEWLSPGRWQRAWFGKGLSQPWRGEPE